MLICKKKVAEAQDGKKCKLPQVRLQGEIGDRVRIGSKIIAVHRQRGAIPHDHVRHSHGAQSVDDQPAGAALDAKDFTLALPARVVRAGGAVVVEETVEPCTVDNSVLAVQDPETERVAVSG